MKLSFSFLFIGLLLFLNRIPAFSQLRISGYYPNFNYSTNYQNIQYGKLTHLYYFSLNPYRTSAGQSDGTLWMNDPYAWFTSSNFSNVITKAKAINPNIKIMIVTGGAPGNDSDLSQRLSYIAGNPGILNAFCNNICNFIKTNNLDGWDLDWEFPNNSTDTTRHANMLAKMRTKIDSMKIADCKNYEITIAVGGGYTSKVCWNPSHLNYCAQRVINYVDYINIMSYDAPVGAGNCNFTSHQGLNVMQTALTDWMTDKKWPAEKLQMGVGFYDNNYTSFVNANGTVSTNYNATPYWGNGGSSCPDMKLKIDYIINQKSSGIFIWELTQDNICAGTIPNCYSLLDCIYEYINSGAGVYDTIISPCGVPTKIISQSSNNIQLFPNPFQNFVNVKINNTEKIKTVKLINSDGKSESTEWNEKEGNIYFNPDLNKGIYILHVVTDKGNYTFKLSRE